VHARLGGRHHAVRREAEHRSTQRGFGRGGRVA
jgi:hypothetical protein